MAEEKSLFTRFFVDHHDGLRDFFRYSFLAGCYTIEEYERYCGLKKSNINTFLIPRLKQIVVQNGEYIDPKKKGRSSLKTWNPNPDWFQDGGSLIWKTFKMRSVKASHVLTYFWVLSRLKNADNRQGISESELKDSIERKFNFIEDDLYPIAEKEKFKVLTTFSANNRIAGLLQEMCEAGIIAKEKRKYVIPENILDQLSVEQQKELYYWTQFYAKVASFSTAGYYLLDSIMEYQRQLNNDYKLQWPEVFCFQNDYFYQMIDEDILLTLYQAWSEEKLIKITYSAALKYKKVGSIESAEEKKYWYQEERREKEEYIIFPVKILPADLYGRKNILVYLVGDPLHPKREKNNRLKVLRLDRIENAEIMRAVEIGDDGERVDTKRAKGKKGLLADEYNSKNYSCGQYKSKYNDALQYSWSNSLSQNSKKIPDQMVIEFDFSEFPCREKQLLLERKHGNITKLEDGKYRMEIILTDQKEILPWLYSFGSTAKIIECAESIKKNELLQKPKEVLKNYGVFSEV